MLPAELADVGSRKARPAACRDKLAAKAAATAARQQQKIDARVGEERAAGEGKRGRKPKPASGKPVRFSSTVRDEKFPDFAALHPGCRTMVTSPPAEAEANF